MKQNILWPFSWSVLFLQSRQSLTQLSGSCDIASVSARARTVAVAVYCAHSLADMEKSGAVTDSPGMTFGYLRFADTRANKVFATRECLHGFAPAKTDAHQRIVKP